MIKIAALLILLAGFSTFGIPHGNPFEPALYSYAFAVFGIFTAIMTLRKRNFRRTMKAGVGLLFIPVLFAFLWEYVFLNNDDFLKSQIVYLCITAGLSLGHILLCAISKKEFGEKRTSGIKDFFALSSLLLLPGIIALFIMMYFWDLNARDIYTFVPKDSIFIIDSKDPIDDWKGFSKSKPWRFLKTNPTFGYINETADWLDSLIQANETMLSMIPNKKLLISAHMTEEKNYDFLYLMDLQKGAKVAFFMDVFQSLLDKMGFETKREKEEGQQYFAIGDKEYLLYLTFKDNILLMSYTKKLLQNAIATCEKPWLPDEKSFKKVFKETGSGGLARLYANYAQLQPFLGVYMDEIPGTAVTISEILTFSGLAFNITDKSLELDGFSNVNDSVPSLIASLRKIKGSDIHSAEILPARMSFFSNIGFRDFNEFFAYFEENMKRDKETWDDFQSSKKWGEKILGITMEEHFFSWFGKEITVGMLPAGLYGERQTHVAFFETKDSTLSREKLDIVARKIKNRPGGLKFETDDYRNYEVNYLEMKGIFKLFFGKLFNKFEKPHYVHINNYVVFSNDTASLHRVVDAYLDGTTLNYDEDYIHFVKKFSTPSSMFVYLNTKELYPWLPTLGNARAQMGMRRNKKYILSFPQVGFQMISNDPGFTTRLYGVFEEVHQNP